MGLLLGFGLIVSIMISSAAGLVILLLTQGRSQRPRRKWDRSTAICCLFSVLLFLIAKATFPSTPTTVQSMEQDFRLATIAFVAAGGSMGFGQASLLGGLLMIIARLSRRP